MLMNNLSTSFGISAMDAAMDDYRYIRDEIEEHEKPQQLLTQYKKKLIESIEKCQLKAFHRVLASGIDPNFCYQHDKYPLHYSVLNKSSTESDAIFETLLYSGDLDVTDRFGSTPLHYAVTTSPERVMALIEAGCSIDSQDNAGMTALMKAFESPLGLITVRIMLDSGCNVHIKDVSHKTAIHHVILTRMLENSIRKKEIIYQLVYSGLSICEPDKRGDTPVVMELKNLGNYSRPLKEDEFIVLQTLIRLGRNIPSLTKSCTAWLKRDIHRTSKSTHILLFDIIQPVLGLTSLSQLYKLYSESNNYDAKLLETMKQYAYTPRTLKSTCRYKIRSVLKERLLLVQDQLPLPTVLRNYLLLQ